MSDRLTYQCHGCKRTGCKLWREYSTFLDHITLECRTCALKSQGKPHGWRCEYGSDAIGWRVPACPDALPDGDWKLPTKATFWGYTRVPRETAQWWKDLPE